MTSTRRPAHRPVPESAALDAAVQAIQFAYPQVYYACHTRHARKRSNGHHVSGRDLEMLVHLDGREPTSLSELAGHMDLALSTVSETVSRLESLGYVRKTPGVGADRRTVAIVLTPAAVEAVRATSVLEAARLAAVLARLSAVDRARVVEGLVCLARACRRPLPDRARRVRRRVRS